MSSTIDVSVNGQKVVPKKSQLGNPLVSIIVPTFKEAQNLPILIPQVCAALDEADMLAEILIVDDNSPDDTVQVCKILSEQYPVKLLVRTEDRGLSSAVLHGLNNAIGEVLLVMDADLSHPPEKVPELVEAILGKQGDFVIGSRYVPGGTTDDSWSLFRWINSQVATVMSRGLTSSRDPMAGFFALSREVFGNAKQLNPIGYKIGLELIVKCHCKNIHEVPIHFRDRLHGESKLSLTEQVKYVQHLGRLYRFKMGEWFTPFSFAAVGASGTLIDLLLHTLLMLSFSFPVARALAIFTAMNWNFLGNRFLTFSDRDHQSQVPVKQYLMYCGCSLFAALVSWGASSYLWQYHAEVIQYPIIAAIIGIAGGVIINYLFSNYVVFPKKQVSASEQPVALAACALKAVAPEADQKNEEQELKKKGGTSAPCLDKQLAGKKRLAVWAGGFAVLIAAMCVTYPSWFRNEIDGLDQAHNVMTSVFFYDFFRDAPLSDPVGYVYNYQRQYPALGFTFWPPLFHAIAGAVMQITGPGILPVRLVLTGFTVLFALSMYFTVTRVSSWKIAIAAVVLAVTTPVLFQLENTNMLEVPSLAMCFLAIWMYQKLTTRGTWKSNFEAIAAAIVCAAIVYTKQPAVFILPAIALDLIISHRHLLREKRTWFAGVLTVFLMVPLALFTLKFGKVNIAQSIGNQGNIYVDHHQVASRWSFDAWTYYPQLIGSQIPILLLLFSAVGILLVFMKKERVQKHGLWIWAIICWYGMFSFFDNKQIRFVAYVVPFLSILACVAWEQISRKNIKIASVCMMLAAVVAVQNVREISTHPPRGYNQMTAMLSPMFKNDASGNLACFGEDHHLFTAQLRLLDKNRQRFNLRGDDILADSDDSLLQAIEDYQVRWIAVQPELPLGKMILAEIKNHPKLFKQQSEKTLFDNGRKSFPVTLYKYQGELAATMKTVPLQSKLQGITAQDE